MKDRTTKRTTDTRRRSISSGLGQSIRMQMVAHRMKQHELARKLGVSPSTVSMWLSGDVTPRLSRIDDMCQIFGCRREDLINSAAIPDDTDPAGVPAAFLRKLQRLDAEQQVAVLMYMDTLEDRSSR